MQIGNQKYPYTGTQIICGTTTVGATAAVLVPGTVPVRGVEITADSANSDYILIGNQYGQYKKLTAGTIVSISIDDVQKIWAKSNSGTQTITYFGVI